MNEQFDSISQHFVRHCIHATRYRVGWLTGIPCSGKTTLARSLAEVHQWQYIDYTLDEGYLDALTTEISSYTLDDLVRDIRMWCDKCCAPVLIIDHIDAILTTWAYDQRRVWVNRLCQQQYLPCGLIVVSHLFTCEDFAFLRPELQQSCIYISE